MCQLTILMPCLNESETLSVCIKKAMSYIERSGISGEVLISDNGSTDGSQEIALSLGAKVIQVSEKGYGSALFNGSLAASGEWIIMGDSDDSYDFSSLDLFVEKLKSGYDLVMGNRFQGGIEPGAMPWKNRYIGNPMLTLIGRLLFKCPAKDFHCGLRGYRKDAFLKMDLRTTGMEFASEMVIKSKLFNLRIAEVPTTLSKDGRSRPPHLKPWRDGWRHLRFMLLFNPKWLFIIPGFIMIITSFIVYLRLLIGPVTIGSVTFDIHTLLFAVAGVVSGCLFLSSGITVRMLGIREGLLIDHQLIEKIRRSPFLEIGGTTGLLMGIAGLTFGLWAFGLWKHEGYGQLNPETMIRHVSLSILLIMLGGIMVTTALLIGFLSIPTRKSLVVEES